MEDVHNGKVSIVVPVYNVEKYITECLESLIAQTYTNLEILIIDDGSTDSSGVISDEFAGKDSRIRVFHKKNEGLSAARNFGLERVTGDYISFIDSDDYIDHTFVEKLLQCLIENEADMAFCNYYYCWEKYNDPATSLSRIKEKRTFSPDEYLKLFYTYGGPYAVVWNKLYRRAVYKDIRFKVGIKTEDAQIALSMVDQCKLIANTTEVLYYYRQRNGSIMAGNKEKLLLSDMSWLEEHMHKLKDSDRMTLYYTALKLYISIIEKRIMYCGKDVLPDVKKRLNAAMREFMKSNRFRLKVKAKYCVGYLFPKAFGRYYAKADAFEGRTQRQ